MRSLKVIWNRFADRKNGCGPRFSTTEKIYSAALDVSAWMDRPWPSLILLAAIASFLCSCGPHTRPDPAPAYTDGNYKSVEFEICGRYYFGVGGCHFASGDSAAATIGIQGFADGEITILSDLCHVDWKHRYSDNEFVKVTLSELFGSITLSRLQSCTLRVLVSPDPQRGSEEKIYPRVGEVSIEVRSPGTLGLSLPIADQVRASTESDNQGFSLSMPVAGEYLMTKCDGENIQHTFAPGLVTFPVLDRKSSCKYQYFIRTDDGKKYSQVFLRNVFAANTILLARPSVERTDKKICIESDPTSTTFLAIDDRWTNKSRLCRRGSGPFKIRVFTTRRNYYELVP